MLSKVRSLIIVSFAVLSLSACKEVLYSELSEHDANDMVAVLAASNIVSSREMTKKDGYNLLVSGVDVASAIVVLRSEGFPRQKYLSLGDVFNSEGIIGTPFEEHARFIHAMNEELSHTISQIDGTRSARVLITAPPKGRYDQEAPKATASVSIQHESSFAAAQHVPNIKILVAYSVANLSYDDVAVALFESGGPQIRKADPREADSVTRAGSLPNLASITNIYQQNARLVHLIFISIATVIFFVTTRRISTTRKNGKDA